MTFNEAADTQIPLQLESNDHTWPGLAESDNLFEHPELLHTINHDMHGGYQSGFGSSKAIAHLNPTIALMSRTPSLSNISRPVPEASPYTRNPTLEAYSKQGSLATDLVSADSAAPPLKVRRRRRRKPPLPPDEAAAKRMAFLKRNRDAVSKCREKKTIQTKEVETEERTGQQINQVPKDELKKVLGEITELKKLAQDIPCKEDCEGCGRYAPRRRDKLVNTTSRLSTSMFHEGERTMGNIDQKFDTSTTTFPNC